MARYENHRARSVRGRAAGSGARTRATRIAFAASLLPLVACAGDAGPTGAANLTGVPDLVIENGTAGLAAEFRRVAGLALDSAGRIYVADAQAHEVRVFTPDGAHAFTIGGAGGGPTEFSGPCCLAFDDTGRLWVRDAGNARYVILEPRVSDAEPAGTVRMAHGDVSRQAPVTFDVAGRVIDVGLQPGEGAASPHTARMHIDARGGVSRRVALPVAPPESLSVHTVQRAMGTGVSTYFLQQPYGPVELVAHAPAGDFAYALSSRYSVVWFDEYGDTVRVVERPNAQGPELSDAERARAEDRIRQDVERVGIAREAVPFGVPARKAPLRSLFFDDRGRLWVELSVADGADRRADVYDREGGLAFTAAWPAGIEIRDNAIFGDVALGVGLDSLGIERVVRLRFRAGR